MKFQRTAVMVAPAATGKHKASLSCMAMAAADVWNRLAAIRRPECTMRRSQDQPVYVSKNTNGCALIDPRRKIPKHHKNTRISDHIGSADVGASICKGGLKTINPTGQHAKNVHATGDHAPTRKCRGTKLNIPL